MDVNSTEYHIQSSDVKGEKGKRTKRTRRMNFSPDLSKKSGLAEC